MKKDKLASIFKHYRLSPDQLVVLTMRNGARHSRFIRGFVMGDKARDEGRILPWHLVSARECNGLDHDGLGNPLGIWIDRRDIVSVKWEQS